MNDNELQRQWNKYTRRHKSNVFNAIFYDTEIVKEEDICVIVSKVADFFDLPEPLIKDKCDTMAQILIGDSSKKCELYYNIEMLKAVGINNKDAFTLCFVHEMAHQLMFKHKFGLFCCERWIQELAADLAAGLYAGNVNLATGKYKYALSIQEFSITHPAGKLREEIVDYGRMYLEKHNSYTGTVTRLIFRLIPAFVYSHYNVLKSDWFQFLHELEFPTPPPKPIAIEDLPDSNLIKQFLMKSKANKEDDRK